MAANTDPQSEGETKHPEWRLRLYVAGQTPKSVAAFANLKQICETHLKGQYEIEIIDLLVNPTLAQGDQIVAVPTLVRQLPPPVGGNGWTQRGKIGRKRAESESPQVRKWVN